ncbi:protein FAR1-RELATED SEQUENCE 5-like [Vitis riparia]|uniref:protein FAR1-RELATED SEQUENCE 5-like n=1 Tax=Vitis riparia TaxID=96939 RepID=UPI00155A0829|nr:protein FAR1-RELATED SEQUENCE 5-like [Vitis riparia]
MEKTIKQEFEVKAEDVVNDDAYTGGTYKLGGNGWEEKVLKGISVEEVCKMKFACIDKAETFYNMLAKLTGFSIRKDDLKRDKNGDIISRKWVCSKEGHRATKFIENDNRQREPRSLTRVGCEAAFRVGLNRKDGKWIVKEFIGDHNHNLVDAINRQFLRSHRTISNPDKAQVDVLRKVGVKTTQIMDYMVKQSGGHEHVGFTQKDIYNHIDAMRRSEIKDGDAEAALAYLCEKAEMDSSFFYKFNIDEESRLANLFWADSTARMDYACLGDVLAFDTTYRTNAYKKPLVVLVGVNHHHQTVVFGCTLLIDESVGTYEWVLETFLEAMMNKKPISVVTDGDKAMRKNVHIKDFSSIFARCMFMRGNEEEFEKVEHLEEIPQSCIMKMWTKLAKVYTRSVPVNETDNDMDRFVRYGSLSSMCNKLSYFASDTSSSFIEAKNEIQNLTARMEELYNYNLKGNKIAADGATGTNQVRDPKL